MTQPLCFCGSDGFEEFSSSHYVECLWIYVRGAIVSAFMTPYQAHMLIRSLCFDF